MDRRKFLTAAAAVAVAPLLPAIAEAEIPWIESQSPFIPDGGKWFYRWVGSKIWFRDEHGNEYVNGERVSHA